MTERLGVSALTVLAGLLMVALAAAAKGWSPAADGLSPPAARVADGEPAAGDQPGEMPAAREPEVGELAPPFVLPAIDGGRIALEELRGRHPVLLVVWATWCPPCIQEFAELKRLQRNFAGRGLQILAVGVRYEQSAENVRTFARDMEVDFPVLYDESSELVQQYGISVIPSNYLIDRSGVLRFKSNGLPPEIDEQVETVLGGA